jgi:hypothetical protein
MSQDDPAHRAEVRAALGARSKGFERFAVWEAAYRSRSTPGEAVSAAAWLYDLLPVESRSRPIDTTGVTHLHQSFSRFRNRP